MNGISFITWYPSCRRSDSIARELGGVSHLIHYLGFKQPLHAPFKYALQTASTWWRLLRERPQVVLVAAPPIVAVIGVWLYCLLFRARFVIDAHTGVFDDARWTWMLPITRFLARRAAGCVVTNEHLAVKVREWGATAVIIGDVPVEFADVPPARLGDGFQVVVINTFSVDEPLGEVVEAARRLPSARFHVTGNPKSARIPLPEDLPSNLRFTGWLSDDGYASLLRAADAVVCLTTHDHTMQRGAYEAMALEKPLVTSDWALLRATFSRGTVHVANTGAGIEDGLRRVMAGHATFKDEMRQLRRERRAIFTASLTQLKRRIESTL